MSDVALPGVVGAVAAADPPAGEAPAEAPKTKPWHEQLPAELRTNEFLQGIDDVPGLARKAIELNAAGAAGPGIPGPDATDEQKRAFWSAMGVPDAPGAYQLPELPEGVQLDSGFIQWAQEAMFNAGVGQRGFEQTVTAYLEYQAGVQREKEAALQKLRDEGIQALKDGEWRGRFSEMKALAVKAANRYLGPEMVQALTDSGAIEDPRLLKGLAKIGQDLGEDRMPGGRPPSPPAPPERAYPNSPEMYEMAERRQAQRSGGVTATPARTGLGSSPTAMPPHARPLPGRGPAS